MGYYGNLQVQIARLCRIYVNATMWEEVSLKVPPAVSDNIRFIFSDILENMSIHNFKGGTSDNTRLISCNDMGFRTFTVPLLYKLSPNSQQIHKPNMTI